MKQSKKITVRFPKRMKAEMLNALIKAGYGLRGKSKWVKESILLFLQQNNFVEYVEHGGFVNQAELEEVEAFYIDEEMVRLMKNAFVQVRSKYPLFEGVQSALVRSAVVYRLMI